MTVVPESEMESQGFLEEARALFNQVGLWADMDIGRLIGYAEDEYDSYWIVRMVSGKTIHCSMVGHFISLKDIYPRYEHLEKTCAMNKCHSEPVFLVEKTERGSYGFL